MRRVECQGTPVLLARQGGRVFALAETSSRLGGPLSEGTLGPDSVRRPWHGSCFGLDDGRVLDGPAVHPQPRLEVRTRDGRIEVRKERAAPSLEAAPPRGVQPVPDWP
jgi:nitrite reductase/ring-hydroxylating ferredoxin subunit